MLKHILQRIDQSLFGGAVRKTYQKVKRRVTDRLTYPQITPLPSGVGDMFGLKARFEFFESAQYFLQVNRMDGVYLEFGCHELNTFRMALNTLGSYGKPNCISRFYAFDSFEGMPSPEGIDQQKIWRAGMNVTPIEAFYEVLKRDLGRVEPVKGFYRDSLKSFRLPGNAVPVLAYIDCDYYSSTKEVLEFLERYLRHGLLIAFDDWDCYYGDPQRGQRKAFEEFQKRVVTRFRFVEFLRIRSGGQSFICHEADKIGLEVL